MGQPPKAVNKSEAKSGDAIARGQPRAFIPEVRTAVLGAISAGMTRADAAGLAGISLGTLEKWIAIGTALQEEREHPRAPHDLDSRADYVRFVMDYKTATARGRGARVNQITVAAQDSWTHLKSGKVQRTPPPAITYFNTETGELSFTVPDPLNQDWEKQFSGQSWAFKSGQWQAAAWYLERTAPEDWARTEKLQIFGGIAAERLNRLFERMQELGYAPESMLDEMETRLDGLTNVADDSGTG